MAIVKNSSGPRRRELRHELYTQAVGDKESAILKLEESERDCYRYPLNSRARLRGGVGFEDAPEIDGAVNL